MALIFRKTPLLLQKNHFEMWFKVSVCFIQFLSFFPFVFQLLKLLVLSIVKQDLLHMTYALFIWTENMRRDDKTITFVLLWWNEIKFTMKGVLFACDSICCHQWRRWQQHFICSCGFDSIFLVFTSCSINTLPLPWLDLIHEFNVLTCDTHLTHRISVWIWAF